MLLPNIPCLFGTMIGTYIYRILKSPSALFARLKTLLAVFFLFSFMGLMFWKFPDISKEGIHFNFTTSSLYSLSSRYTRSLLQYNVLSLAAYWTIILIAGSLLLHGLITVYWSWYCNYY